MDGQWIVTAPMVAVLTAMTLGSSLPAQAQSETTAEAIQRGALTFRIHCQNCHGALGKGDGPVAEALKTPPPSLTLLSVPPEGRFPADEVRRKIDGREPIMSHGPSEMPVWGWTFDVRGDRRNAEVERRIEDLMALLRDWQAPLDPGEKSSRPA